ncbi:MAG: hypothetical protein IPN29_04170 [Saprospiraceae bacterium]|nr:hypothetical protein [Saprospiraceae bacterium]
MNYKGLHILLAFNLLVSTSGLSTFEHICSKNGSTFSIFVKPNSCCSKKKSKCCSDNACTKHLSNHDFAFTKKQCCENKTHLKKLNVSATELTKIVLTDIQPIFYNPIAGTILSENDFLSENEKTIRFYLYKPPPLSVDNLRVLYQSFLC